MDAQQIAHWRLRSQRLIGTPYPSPERVLQAFGAMQAQEFTVAKWSIAMRTARADITTIDRLLARGVILRTHVVRPTWHFVLPADLPWLLALTAPRVDALNASMYRQLQLDAKVFRRSHAVLERLLAAGHHLTRTEIAAHLHRARLPSSGFALAYVLMKAELDAVICSGAIRGKQHTYALFDQRVPATARLNLARDEALAELARRFFSTRGPATTKDFACWSSLTVAQARAGLELAQSALDRFVINGRTYWLSGKAAKPAKLEAPRVELVQGYDEVIASYRESRDVLLGAPGSNVNGSRRPPFMHAILLDGQLAGHWRPRAGKTSIAIDTHLHRPFDRIRVAALRAAAQRFARFLRLPLA